VRRWNKYEKVQEKCVIAGFVFVLLKKYGSLYSSNKGR